VIGRNQLPAAVQAAIPEERFLYALRGKGGYVVREVTDAGRSSEREFDEGLGRFLTVEERRQRLPPGDRFVFAGDEPVTVTVTHHIDADTGELRAHFAIVDDAGRPVAELTRDVFRPTPWRPEEVVAEVMRAHQFPQRYASWPRDEKVRYWAAKLHRLRRARGESGRDEDDLYSPELVGDMEQLDPQVRDLLADVIARVGELEQTDPGAAIDAFEQRSGISIRP